MSVKRQRYLTVLGCSLVIACAGDRRDDSIETAGVTAGSADTGGQDAGDDQGDGGDGKFDVAQDTDTAGNGGSCKVNPEGDGTPPCQYQAPPDSFDPDVQWSWDGDGGFRQSIVIPLVANLTDDDGNDEIDLCDVPDVIVLAFETYNEQSADWNGFLYVLDGSTGMLHFKIDTPVLATATPALGDIDNDGIPEIVAVAHQGHAIVAFEHDGTLKWQSGTQWTDAIDSAMALADLDNDGDVEIIAGNLVLDHQGNTVANIPDAAGQDVWGNATAAADLDDDGDLEVVMGRSAYHHDGTELFKELFVAPGYPQIADLDADGLPEILIQNADGLSMLEHDGTVKFKNLTPTGLMPSLMNWMRPSTVHDFDGDGEAEFAVSSQNLYAVYEGDGTVMWSAQVADVTGITAGTAFDFIGDGVAEAMYADEHELYAFDGNGGTLMSVPRSSGTIIEYPVVADVDNDGSAEIVVVSNEGWFHDQTAPTVQVIRDVEDRWIPSRRIWNQHTYHVTNVREDGTIPQNEQPSWELLNTFRTNAQMEGGGVCKPPEG